MQYFDKLKYIVELLLKQTDMQIRHKGLLVRRRLTTDCGYARARRHHAAQRKEALLDVRSLARRRLSFFLFREAPALVLFHYEKRPEISTVCILDAPKKQVAEVDPSRLRVFSSE
ncbi:hypothetical protein NDU88_001171 [Pleurodeles waltl]|uniref:Uncharacterized protein n=1 Tax=Pleurodeles waltl TaxID=8319 RepID=A0AAV7SYS1_PLEWA|nr:hypothetical protein NDU88_001171 [Pleurodeles waltl]